MNTLQLYVSVPVACFRVAQAREFWETYPCPPPSTVYGMLLSLVGETDREAHRGAEIAIALLSKPDRSTVLRTLWRIKNKKSGLGLAENATPGYHELLTDIRLSVWIRPGAREEAPRKLVDRVDAALTDPASVVRFGGLCLGESTHLVDEVRRWRTADPTVRQVLLWDDGGDLSLPIWVDHVGSRGTRWGQFRLGPPPEDPSELPERAWTEIAPPRAAG